jgi:hypothetical protein
MNNHPYGISQLTAAHSHDLLDEGRRRQLAKAAARKPHSLLRQPARLVRAWASRALALAGSLVGAAPDRSGTPTPGWCVPLTTGTSVVPKETI